MSEPKSKINSCVPSPANFEEVETALGGVGGEGVHPLSPSFPPPDVILDEDIEDTAVSLNNIPLELQQPSAPLPSPKDGINEEDGLFGIKWMEFEDHQKNHPFIGNENNYILVACWDREYKPHRWVYYRVKRGFLVHSSLKLRIELQERPEYKPICVWGISHQVISLILQYMKFGVVFGPMSRQAEMLLALKILQVGAVYPNHYTYTIGSIMGTDNDSIRMDPRTPWAKTGIVSRTIKYLTEQSADNLSSSSSTSTVSELSPASSATSDSTTTTTSPSSSSVDINESTAELQPLPPTELDSDSSRYTVVVKPPPPLIDLTTPFEIEIPNIISPPSQPKPHPEAPRTSLVTTCLSDFVCKLTPASKPRLPAPRLQMRSGSTPLSSRSPVPPPFPPIPPNHPPIIMPRPPRPRQANPPARVFDSPNQFVMTPLPPRNTPLQRPLQHTPPSTPQNGPRSINSNALPPFSTFSFPSHSAASNAHPVCPQRPETTQDSLNNPFKLPLPPRTFRMPQRAPRISVPLSQYQPVNPISISPNLARTVRPVASIAPNRFSLLSYLSMVSNKVLSSYEIAPPPSRMAPPPSRMAPPPSRMELLLSRMAPPPSRMEPPPSRMEPPPSRMEPPPSRMEPPPSRMAPPPSRMARPPSRMVPPPSRMEPPPSRMAPAFSRMVPPSSRMEPPPSRMEPPPSRMVPPPTRMAPPPAPPPTPNRPILTRPTVVPTPSIQKVVCPEPIRMENVRGFNPTAVSISTVAHRPPNVSNWLPISFCRPLPPAPTQQPMSFSQENARPPKQPRYCCPGHNPLEVMLPPSPYQHTHYQHFSHNLPSLSSDLSPCSRQSGFQAPPSSERPLCKWCGLTFPDKKRLRIHYLDVHRRTETLRIYGAAEALAAAATPENFVNTQQQSHIPGLYETEANRRVVNDTGLPSPPPPIQQNWWKQI